MKSFQQFITEMDTGLTRKLATSGIGGAQFSDDQEMAISTVTNLIMMAANSEPARLMTMLKTLSSNEPAMKAIYDQIDVSALRMAAKKHVNPEEDSNDDNMITTSPDDAMRHGV
jgi:hypothetical protein